MDDRNNHNRLINEKSPYLLQHARNPVNWYPWGNEAFERALSEDKPVFLSIGYSTCHWCHVMEMESFSDVGMAALLNENFICIKVDREERPDIDNVYMSAVVAMTGRGGWPLTVFLTPDRRPFYGGTYFPPEDRWGIAGLRTVLLSVTSAWNERRNEINRSAGELTRVLRSLRAGPDEGATLDVNTLRGAYSYFEEAFDKSSAGFGPAPKFPMGHNLSFLLRYAAREEQPGALMMVESTLRAMAGGGLYDQVGGGFHRYSTDADWRIPHFEKMLYDQAVLAKAYLEAFQYTGHDFYARIARETLDYVLRDLRDDCGGFYSAEDADSAVPGEGGEKREGAFYLWSHDEVLDAIGEEAGRIAAHHFGIRPGGNAPADPHGEFAGRNILYRAHSPEETARQLDMSLTAVETALSDARRALLDARTLRPRPHIDDKILTDWNGLMISSLAAAYRILNEPRYRDAAEAAARFVMEELTDGDGRLLHRYRDGDSGISATLDDYAFFIHGLIDLYEATFETTYLRQALRLTSVMRDLFWDEETGGFFFTANDSEGLIVRVKEVQDGAIPSGNSVAALDLIRLGRLTAKPEFESLAAELMKAVSGSISNMPASHTFMLMALDFAVGHSSEIVIAEGEDIGTANDMADAVYARFIPNRVMVKHPASGDHAAEMLDLAPFLAEYRAVDGKTAAYVCRNYSCRAPATSVEDLRALLQSP